MIARKILLLVMLMSTYIFGATLNGLVTEKGSDVPLVGANVIIEGTVLGASTDHDGYFQILNLPQGEWEVEVVYVGYKTFVQHINVTTEKVVLGIELVPTIYKTQDILVETTRAKERETPVAFTNIGADAIAKNFTVQDVPHLFKNSVGVYVTTDGGSGLGDSKTYIRGFDEQRISVMINGIEVNDPESKKVYWSNWGALSSGASSIQVQRGAGSSTYGAGTFGGSINVLTDEGAGKEGAAAYATSGMYGTYKLGFAYNTGLRDESWSFMGKFNYLTGNGWRNATFYEGMQYYMALSWYPSEKHTVRTILHGAPQYHSYAYYSNPAKDYARYGTKYNSHPYVWEQDGGITSREADGTSLGEILTMTHIGADNGGEVYGNGTVSFDNNVYHKPQLEVHWTWDINKNTYVQTDLFGSLGRGYGENINGYYKIGRTDNGTMTMNSIYDAGQYQYRAYSIHNQYGVISALNTKLGKHKIVTGLEYRYWWARHYGQIINTFGQEDVRYYIGGAGQDFAQGDTYYDYDSIKPTMSAFVNGLWKFGEFSVMTDLLYSVRKYNIAESMPSNNNRPVDDGSYLMGDTTYNLVDIDREYQFLSPKFGVNYNINKNLNMFVNVSRTYNEPRVKFFYNYGQPLTDLDPEISTDYEFGSGYRTDLFDAKLNLYQIDFENKALRVTDPTMANMPGYDYKGRRYIPVGSARYRGIEFDTKVRPFSFLQLGAALTLSENAWTDDISDLAKEDLGIKEGMIEPEYPQKMLILTGQYASKKWFSEVAWRYFADYYILPDNGDVDLYVNSSGDVTEDGNTLPSWNVMDFVVGYQTQVAKDNPVVLSFHLYNVFNEKYYQIGNSYGFLYGPERSFQVNLQLGI